MIITHKPNSPTGDGHASTVGSGSGRVQRRRAAPKLAAILAVVALLGVGCGNGEAADETMTTSATTTPSLVDLSDADWVDRTDESEVTIQSRDNTFLPGYVVVKAGTPITFRNVGRTEHNAMPVDEISFEGIAATEFGPQTEHTITFEEPGDYPYYCSLHGTTTKGMVGAIRVVA